MIYIKTSHFRIRVLFLNFLLKVSLLIFVIHLGFNSFLYSQNGFGIKCGINSSHFSEADYSTTCYITYIQHSKLPHFGIEYFRELQHHVFVFSELLYVVKGSDVQIHFYNVTEYNYIRLNYIELPLMVKYSPLKHLRIGAGPYMGLYLFGKAKEYHYIGITGILNADRKIVIANKISKGINVDFDLVYTKFIITVRVSKTISTELKYNPYLFSDYKKRSFTVFLSFSVLLNKYNLKKRSTALQTDQRNLEL